MSLPENSKPSGKAIKTSGLYRMDRQTTVCGGKATELDYIMLSSG